MKEDRGMKEEEREVEVVERERERTREMNSNGIRDSQAHPVISTATPGEAAQGEGV